MVYRLTAEKAMSERPAERPGSEAHSRKHTALRRENVGCVLKDDARVCVYRGQVVTGVANLCLAWAFAAARRHLPGERVRAGPKTGNVGAKMKKACPGLPEQAYTPATTYFPAEQYHRRPWLNYCVRDGNRCDPRSIVTDKAGGGLSTVTRRPDMDEVLSERRFDPSARVVLDEQKTEELASVGWKHR